MDAFQKCMRDEGREHPGLSRKTVVQICRDHLKACPADLAWEMQQGVKEYIQGKTSADPYYALVTGALHGAPADYTQTQPFVDEIMRRGPEAWTDPDANAQFLNTTIRGSRYQFSRQKAPVLADLTRCYLQHGRGKRAAIACATSGVKGVGRKGAQLMLEYLGDDNAVAVDRHVFNYVCTTRGFCPSRPATWGSHGMRVPDSVMPSIEAEIRRIAKECGKKPTDVQVAAWLKGACDTRLRGVKKGKPFVYLGPDKTVDCRKRFYEAPSIPRIRLTKKPRRSRPPRGVKRTF